MRRETLWEREPSFLMRDKGGEMLGARYDIFLSYSQHVFNLCESSGWYRRAKRRDGVFLFCNMHHTAYPLHARLRA